LIVWALAQSRVTPERV